MKKFSFILALVAALALLTNTPAFAGTAYNVAFTTSITYQNVGSGNADVVFTFYNQNSGAGVDVSQALNAGAGASLFVGGLSEVSSGFKGSVVMSADEPVVATMVQIPQNDPDVKNRPLSNGFSSGSPTVLLATVLKSQFNQTSRFAVQNAHNTPVDLTINIYNAADPTANPVVVTHPNLPVGAAQYFDAGTLSQITAASLNGSATVTAVESGTNTPANIVATVLELNTNSGGASSFEGVSAGANTVYMPSAICNAFGGQSTAYAVQNTGNAVANVTVTYNNGNIHVANIQPGAKNSFLGCAAVADNTNPAGFSGAAIITSNQPIVAIGKVVGGGLTTAFVGEASGSETLALPYVRFTLTGWDDGSRQRTFIAIQNVGSALPANSVVAKYLNKNGDVVGIHTFGAIAAGEKVNTNATHPGVVLQAGFTQAQLNEFGTPDGNPGGGFGGSVIIEGPAGSQLVAVARVQSKFGAGSVGEDYNGIGVD